MEGMQFLQNPIVVAAGAALAVLLIFVGIGLASREKERVIEDRLDQYGGRVVAEDAEGTSGKKQRSAMEGLDEAMARRGFAANMKTDLAQADLKLRVAEFMMLTVMSAILFLLLGRLIFGSILFGLIFGVLGFFVPRIYVGSRKRKRLNTFNDQLGDTITLLANSLRSGASIVQSMETVANQLPNPMAGEFHRVTQEIGLGLHYEQALNNMLRRMPSDDLDLMITAVNIQGRVGGNLAEILDTIGHTIRERVRIKGEIRVLTAQQMISGYVLTALPIGLGLILYLINKDYMSNLFSDPCGWIMVGVSLVMITGGFLLIRKIVQIEV
jgi:tight adherence protein B